MQQITTDAELAGWLRQVQAGGEWHAECMLSSACAARLPDVRLRALADLALSRMQRRAYQLRRLRSGALHLGVTMTLRDGIRLVEALRQGRTECLTPHERTALDRAQEMAAAAREIPGEEERFRWLFRRLAEDVTYENHQPGSKAYPSVVSACGALTQGRANCQGFADAYWLVCTLAGLKADYQAGCSGRGTHLWNLICIGGCWYGADVSRASRLLRTEGEAAMDCAFRMDDAACRALGLRWDPWMETQQIETQIIRTEESP